MARTLTIGNDHVQRSYALDGHCLRTSQLRHGVPGGRSYTVAPDSDEFAVEFVWEPLNFHHDRQNPVRLTGKDFLLVTAPEGEVIARAVFELVEPQLGLRVTIHIEADDSRPLLHKWLTITPTGREPVSITRVAVDLLHLLGPEPEHGGYGQPLYCGDWFAGVEYPTGLNTYADGAISCAHDGDGYLAVGSTTTSERVVWGGAQPGRVRDSFLDYIDQLRARPVRRYVHYNSWYDVQHDDLNEGNLRECLARLVKELHEDRGAHLAGFVIDDHWDNRGSVWEIDREKFPNGFAKLKADLDAHNLDLGLWFGPVGGYHDERAERVAWYRDQGYETTTNGQYLCLAGSQYHAAFVQQLHQKLDAYRLGYLKFDGMAFGCLDAMHGHPPDDLARQSLARAFIKVLETARAVRPDIFLSITTGTWLSPWWLRWADAVFIGGNDYGWSHELPSREDRDAAITYRDGVMFEDFRVHQDQFPLSSLMSVGVIKGNLNLLGGPDESPDAWRRELVMEVGRGIMQTELYISPERLTTDEWDQLARAINWAEEHDDTLLNHGTMILGDPRKGEVYGYLHTGEGEAIIVVRNPSYRPQAVDLPLTEWCDFEQSEPSMVWQLSPERKLLAVNIGQEPTGLRVALEPFEVLMLACRPQAQLDGVAVIGLAYDGGGLDARWQVPHSVATTQVIASEATRLNLDGIGTIQVGKGITSIDLGEPRYLEEQWGALLHITGTGQQILEASWELDESVAKAELVAVGEWQTPGSGRGWTLHDSGVSESTLTVRSVPDALWEIASVPVPNGSGALTLVPPPTSSNVSLWLLIHREMRQLGVSSENLPFYLPSLPTAMTGGWTRRSHCLWADAGSRNMK